MRQKIPLPLGNLSEVLAEPWRNLCRTFRLAARHPSAPNGDTVVAPSAEPFGGSARTCPRKNEPIRNLRNLNGTLSNPSQRNARLPRTTRKTTKRLSLTTIQPHHPRDHNHPTRPQPPHPHNKNAPCTNPVLRYPQSLIQCNKSPGSAADRR